MATWQFALRNLVAQLDRTAESDHFCASYALSRPFVGRGSPLAGVRHPAYIATILDGLERLHGFLTSPPHSRQSPTGRLNRGKTPVYVFDLPSLGPGFGYPFVAPAAESGAPFVCLPSRTGQSTVDTALQYAQVSAIHEAVHVFNADELPFSDRMFFTWSWLNEGMAVYLETAVAAGCPDHLQYSLDWLDRPDRPLDDERGRYQTAMFVRCLERTCGDGAISQIWKRAGGGTSPIGVITDYLHTEHGIVFANTGEDDFFGSIYCRDAYFLLDPTSTCFSPNIFARFGSRAVTESFEVAPGYSVTVTDKLGHLACRYYVIRAPLNASRIEVRMTPLAPPATPVLKGQLAVLTSDARRGRTLTLTPPPAASNLPPHATVAQFDLSQVNLPKGVSIDHFVLIIANCGVDATSDGQEYELSVEAS